MNTFGSTGAAKVILALLGLWLAIALLERGNALRVVAGPLQPDDLPATQLTSNSGDETLPALAYNTLSGEYLLTWQDDVAGPDTVHAIRARRINNAGAPADVPFLVSNSSSEIRLSPGVAFNAGSDSYLVAWEFAYSDTDHDIYARAVSGDGVALNTELGLAASGQYEAAPAVAANPASNQFLVAWESQNEIYDADIYAALFNSDGTPAVSAFQVAAGNADQRAPAIAYDPVQGQYLVVYRERPYGAEYTEIYARRISSAGDLLGEPIAAAEGGGERLHPRTAYANAARAFLVTWQEQASSSDPWKVLGRRISETGALLDTAFLLSPDDGSDRINPALAYSLNNGEWLAAWEYIDSRGDHDVYARRVGRDSALPDPEFPVSAQSGLEGSPALAADQQTSYLIAWTDERDSSSQGLNLYGAVFPLYHFAGYVYRGSPPGAGTPLAGADVGLYCSSDPNNPGSLLASTTTDGDGAFRLAAGVECGYYSLVEIDPAGYTSTGATSPAGVKKSNNWLQIAAPLAGKNLEGNLFWDDLTPTATYTPSPTRTSTPVNTPTRTPTYTSTPINTPTRTSTYTATPVNTPTHTPTYTPPPGNTPTHTPTLTATPDSSSTPTSTPTASLPDLVITDLWVDGGHVCYQVYNMGLSEAAAGYTIDLYQDGEWLASHETTAVLPAGERQEACFDYEYLCSPPASTLRVAVDTDNIVEESDESNNERQETLACDTTPPVLTSGPTLTQVGRDSAVITWQTDELADSLVLYGTTTSRFDLQVSDPAQVTAHSLELTGLQPGTAYRFNVQSADASGNRRASREGVFNTLLPAGEGTPRLSADIPSTLQGIVYLSAQASDDLGLSRVKFILDGFDLFSDYSPPYQVRLDTSSLADGAHELLIRAINRAGRSAEQPYSVTVLNKKDPQAPSVIFLDPQPGATIYGKVNASAAMNAATGVTKIEWFVDGHSRWIQNVNPPLPTSLSAVFSWDTTIETNGLHRLAVTVSASGAHSTTIYEDVTINNPGPPPPAIPSLAVWGYTTKRVGSIFQVAIKLRNVGTGDATNIILHDYLPGGYQPINEALPSSLLSSVASSFNPGSLDWDVKLTAAANLAPGEEKTFTYEVAPVLYYPNQPPAYNSHLVNLAWQSTSAVPYGFNVKILGLVTSITEWADALADADYLIVTNPGRLSIWYTSAGMNNVLSAMARLAKYKHGALGFFQYNQINDNIILRKIIQPGGIWATALNANFSKPLKGYLLLVGENEILPSWTIIAEKQYYDWGGPIPVSDHKYADTDNDGQPELIVGRLIGDKASILVKAIDSSLGVFNKMPGYAFGHEVALVTSDAAFGNFWGEANVVATKMEQAGYTNVQRLHFRDYSIVRTLLTNLPFVFRHRLAAGDVNGDGLAEIAIAPLNPNVIQVLDGNGNMLSSIPSAVLLYDYLAVGDVLGDKKAEILVANESADKLTIYNSSGGVLAEFPLKFDWGDALLAGDLLGTGKKQILHADADLDWLEILAVQGGPGAYTINPALPVSFGYGPNQAIAAGDMMGDTRDELAYIDTSQSDPMQNRTWFYRPDIQKWEWITSTLGFDLEDGLAIGRVKNDPSGKAQAVVAMPQHNYMYIYGWSAAKGFNTPLGDAPAFISEMGGFATGDIGDIYGVKKDEVFLVGKDQVLRVEDLDNWVKRIAALWPFKAAGVDAIYYQGHGGSDSWDSAVDASKPKPNPEGVFPMDFLAHNPFILATTCNSGNYAGGQDNNNVAEAYLESGAGVYVGSTQVSSVGLNAEFGKNFFLKWSQVQTLGEAFMQQKSDLWQIGGDWTYWVQEYNLYGDPKFAIPNTAAALASSAPGQPAEGGKLLTVNIPGFTVYPNRNGDGFDEVEIPGGGTWLRPGELRIPYFSASFNYPAGTSIQDVFLSEQAPPVITHGLNLPMSAAALKPSTWQPPEPYSGPVEDFFPAQTFTWTVARHTDGTSNLFLTLFPLEYNPLTGDARFYDRFDFQVQTATSPVSITAVTLDSEQYAPGDNLQATVELNNSSTALDVIALASIQGTNSRWLYDGLPLQRLDDLSGAASFIFEWDSTGVARGDYVLNLVLMDTSGNLLDQRSAGFSLGREAGEITNFSVTPGDGEALALALDFTNIGDLLLTGTVTLRIQDSSGIVLQEFRHELGSLAAGQTASFSDQAVKDEAADHVSAVVAYGSTATEPEVLYINSNQRLFLPFLVR